ncbi:putative gag-pol polyprotein [Leuconostoc phage Ln-8]|uniref:Uncharacterized protein n=3 Tax=Unaquatrovirus TaxID=2169622 RepID=A0A059PB19_9CAUD|nr:hypothetical protein HL61_gp30 [Leuconostoc phage LN25]YP_009151931.1 putative gag-pol polyprotein [Leuconostoc phage Ln-8]YP_010080404.1 putative gag-pol polyprotein [Leuconostoc phage Ln-7]AFY98399.1 hypothetical protein phiLN25_030 [Leuconostoc phage LN25]AIM50929.1 putative gag-pol polyprotein [Leuconostoc phage Ln-8]AOT27901.1 putative gag-pol polyprotein [Leuconostoc phage Ln-7]
MIELSSKMLYVTKVLKKSKSRYMMNIGDVFILKTSIQSTHNSVGNDVLRLNLIVNDNDAIQITMNEANRLFRELIAVKEYNEQNVLGEK